MPRVRQKFLQATLTFMVCLSWLASRAADTAQAGTPIVVFMSDFGVLDDSVAICKGVMLSVDPQLRIVDLTHEVTPYSILDGARFLSGAAPYYPTGTVFVAVVDPGVGSTRRALVVKTKRGQFFVLPDNGLITPIADRDGIEAAREITSSDWMIGAALSSTFHGRDIFSPVGAHLARGDDWTRVGPEIPLASLVRLKLAPVTLDEQGLHGQVLATDGPFGNLVTNVTGADFLRLGYRQGETVEVSIAGTVFQLPFVHTFSDVALDRPLLYIDSRGRVGLAINQGNFASAYHVKPPVSISIARPKRRPAQTH
jgi:S-adenosyl-L-methionine hydrolase (adenosine-forming)